MRYSVGLLVGAVLLSASAAVADPFTVTTSQSISVSGYKDDPTKSFPLTQYSINPPVDNSTGRTSGQINGSIPFGIAENFQTYAYVDNNLKEIVFGNNASAIGVSSSVSTTTVVNVSFTNEGNTPIAPKLTSTITPAGFGFAVVNPKLGLGYGDNGANTFGNINAIPLASNFKFNDSSSQGGLWGTASVQFQISQLDQTTGVQQSLVSYSKSLSLTSNVQNQFNSSGQFIGWTVLPNTVQLSEQSTVLGVDLAANDPRNLNNFVKVTPDGSEQALGYQWDATDVTVPLGTIAAGDKTTLIYTTTVSVNNLWQLSNAEGLLIYAGFGDPIGKQGSTGNAASADVFAADSSSSPLGLSFSNYHFSLPTLSTDPVTGDLVLNSISSLGQTLVETPAIDPTTIQDVNVPAPVASPGAAPEPSAWALMMVAVGGMGAALRRSRRHQTV